MKLAKYVGVGAIVAGVAAFSMSDRTESALRASPVIVFASEAISSAAPVVKAAVASVRPSTKARPTRRRSGNFRSFNRYPGPIPTPADWVPPEGPVRIALQAGHWKANEAPPELSGLKDNGTSFEGKREWEVNLAIVNATAALLEKKGYLVDILPAVVPPNYRAHLFISVHADGATNSRSAGYRVAAPRSDATGRASRMATLLEESYGKATGIKLLPDVTRSMENYYAFNFRRYEHSLHPMTIAVILETGFLTNAADRAVIVDEPDRVARAIVDAVVAFPETPQPDPLRPTGGGG